ncbi:ABC transporter substrate-binding protein, partial [bacterium]|nr:ABC transporter substrate-binding protein [bacterium]
MQIGIPKKIVCLTEESVEILYALGLEHLIVGVSSYVRRPPEAMELPKTSVFTHANLGRIKELEPDLVIGFSDIQKDIAKDLIGEGLNVWISNQRSTDEILSYVVMLSSIVGKRQEGIAIVDDIKRKIDSAVSFSRTLKVKPLCYLEEWDEPPISGIRWFSEVIEYCGGVNIFSSNARSSLAKDRIIDLQEVREKNPSYVFACWCGKKFDKDSFLNRPKFGEIDAVLKNQIYELEPEIFLQPGIAPYIDGLEII